MSLYTALTTSVAGLSAQSTSLENISGNIANSSTTAYKRTDTAFNDLVTNSTSNASAATSGSVTATSTATNTVSGSIEDSDTATYMSVDGDGYFVVYEKIGEVDGDPVFSTTPLYTRSGDFTLDEDGYLVNSAGYYLATIELDDDTGNPVSSTPQPVAFEEDFMEAEATTTVELTGNLPSTPSTTDEDNDGMMTTASYSDTSTSTTTSTVTLVDTVLGSENSTFLSQTIDGGSITVYTSNGESVSLQMRWGKVSDEPETWQLYYQSNSDAGDSEVQWTAVDQEYIFDDDGALDPAVTTVTVSSMTIDGENLGDITLDHGDGNDITSYAMDDGEANTTLSQDGASAGEMTSISIDDDGYIVANYSNGKSKNLAEIILASFDGDNYLQAVSGQAYLATEDSGEAILGATGSIVGSSLEASNVDLAEEFSKMIITQQAYTANTRVLSTAQEMLDEIMQVTR